MPIWQLLPKSYQNDLEMALWWKDELYFEVVKDISGVPKPPAKERILRRRRPIYLFAAELLMPWNLSRVLLMTSAKLTFKYEGSSCRSLVLVPQAMAFRLAYSGWVEQ